MNVAVKDFVVGKFLNVLENLLFSPRLHLFDKNTVKTVILWNIITIKKYIFLYFKMFLKRNYQQQLLQSWWFYICIFGVQEIFILSMLKTAVLLNILFSKLISFFRILWWIELKNNSIFENIKSIFVTFDQFKI